MKSARTADLVIVALVLIAAVGFVLHARIYWNWTEDDAYITSRYARNLLQGNGLVFNSGERVEGYSNLSLVLICAAGLRAGLDPIAVAKSVGLVAGVITVFLSYVLARRMAPGGRRMALLAPLYLAISPVLARHSVTGLETALCAMLLTGGVLLATERKGRPAGWLLLATALLLSITRPEGAVFGVLLLAGRIILRRRSMTPWRGSGLAELACFLLLFGAFTCWRSEYFGSFLPNVFYAKARGGLMGLMSGALYSVNFLRDGGGAFLAGFIAVPALLGCATAPYCIALACIALDVGFIMIGGGDWMYHYRFFAPVLPVLAAGVSAGLASVVTLTKAWGRRRIALIAWLALLLGATSLSVSNTERHIAQLVLPAVRDRSYLAQNYEALGRWFHDNSPPTATIAISDIGAVGYYSERRIIDMFGLIDRRIAHLQGRMHYKADPDYVLSQKPDYIVLVATGIEERQLAFLRVPDRLMNANARFQDEYQLVRAVPLRGQNETARIYGRR